MHYGRGFGKSDWVDTMSALLNRRVEVTLTNPDDSAASETVVGVLVSFSLYGEVAVRDDAGIVHYAWPSLKIRELEG